MGLVNWYFDTSVLVAAAVVHHPHHAPALAILEQMLQRKHHGFASAHSLTEFYSVLTRAPFRPPLHPSDAWRIIEQMITPHIQLVVLSPAEYTSVVRDCAHNGWAGGRIHDSVHLRCAQKAQCDRIYTFNVKDFRTLAPKDLSDKIAVP